MNSRINLALTALLCFGTLSINAMDAQQRKQKATSTASAASSNQDNPHARALDLYNASTQPSAASLSKGVFDQQPHAPANAKHVVKKVPTTTSAPLTEHKLMGETTEKVKTHAIHFNVPKAPTQLISNFEPDNNYTLAAFAALQAMKWSRSRTTIHTEESIEGNIVVEEDILNLKEFEGMVANKTLEVNKPLIEAATKKATQKEEYDKLSIIQRNPGRAIALFGVGFSAVGFALGYYFTTITKAVTTQLSAANPGQ